MSSQSFHRADTALRSLPTPRSSVLAGPGPGLLWNRVLCVQSWQLIIVGIERKCICHSCAKAQKLRKKSTSSSYTFEAAQIKSFKMLLHYHLVSRVGN